jgi:hypothetical protein
MKASLFPFAVALLCSVLACSSVQRAAQQDPMRCERDPTCAKKQLKNRDCTTQCADNIECMDRCRQAQGDGLGHKP